MKIEIKQYGTIYTVETENDDLDTDEILDILVGLLEQTGYTKESVQQSIKDLLDE